MENSKYENNAFVIPSPVKYQADSFRALTQSRQEAKAKVLIWNHGTMTHNVCPKYSLTHYYNCMQCDHECCWLIGKDK